MPRGADLSCRSIPGRSLLQDREAGSFRQSIHVSAYPLAEGLSYVWWSPQGRVVKATADAPGLRLASTGDGFPWPDLEFQPDGDAMHLTWQRSGNERLTFVDGGRAVVSVESVVRASTAVIEGTLSRLDDAGIHHSPLHDEWAVIRSTSIEERDFLLAAARLGIDPYDVPDPLASELVSAGDSLPGELLNDILAVAGPADLGDIVSWVADVAPSADGAGSEGRADLQRWEHVVRGAIATHLFGPAPWAEGYAAAQQLRPLLNENLTELLELDEVVKATTTNFPYRSIEAVGKRLTAIDLVVPDKKPTTGRRFAQARALYRGLTSSPGSPFALTAARTGLQQAERAFAAELLAPVHGLRERLGAELATLTDDDVEDLAVAFGVNGLVIQHQIDNSRRMAA